MISALFRLSPTKGQIYIDGVDLQTLPFSVSRRAISVIPQEPVLFSGTVRQNIDPFERFNDDEIWAALDAVEMKSVVQVMSGGLGLLSNVSEAGGNFSIGQRQLLCLARATLVSNKVCSTRNSFGGDGGVF